MEHLPKETTSSIKATCLSIGGLVFGVFWTVIFIFFASSKFQNYSDYQREQQDATDENRDAFEAAEKKCSNLVGFIA